MKPLIPFKTSTHQDRTFSSAAKPIAVQRRQTAGQTLLFDPVVVEEPLQIRLLWRIQGQQKSGVLTITMRTPGQDEALVNGLLLSEGIIRKSRDIVDIRYEQDENKPLINQIQVTLADRIEPDSCQLGRNLFTHSSCGMCGKTSLRALELNDPPSLDKQARWLDPPLLQQLPKRMNGAQSGFSATGGMHASALFSESGELTVIAEDVGRHNALDKLVGMQVQRTEVTPAKSILLVSGRASFELVQKAVMAGYPVLAAIGAPSTLAVSAAQRFDMTLIGFLKPQSFNVYHGQWRLADDS